MIPAWYKSVVTSDIPPICTCLGIPTIVVRYS